jgi:hypothetical protein
VVFLAPRYTHARGQNACLIVCIFLCSVGVTNVLEFHIYRCLGIALMHRLEMSTDQIWLIDLRTEDNIQSCTVKPCNVASVSHSQFLRTWAASRSSDAVSMVICCYSLQMHFSIAHTLSILSSCDGRVHSPDAPMNGF